MVKRLAAILLFGCSPLALAQSSVDFANLREDVQGLSQKVGDLTLRIEQLEHENAQLRARSSGLKDVVTTTQLNAAVADLTAAIQAANASSKHEILEQVGTQMEKLARQTNAALDAVSAKPVAVSAPRATEAAPGPNSSATAAATKDGLYYTIQRGDTLALICKKTGGKFQEVIDANKLTDPSKIRVGQILFIPGGK
jgi:LysM repeat protein